MIKYAVITDEISQNIFEAAKLASEFGLDGLEIRSINERGPHELTQSDIDEIKSAMDMYSLECCAISAPFFKCGLNSVEIEASIEILKKCIALAKKLGTKYIRGFTFFKEKEFSKAIPEIKDAYNRIIPLLEANDVYILLESDPSVYASCGKKLSLILKEIASDRVKGLWDPGNDIYSPENEIPFPDGYLYMKGMISHIHVKDAVKNKDGGISGVPFGEGEVDFDGQLEALKKDGYSGYIVMETHYRIKHEISDELLTLPKGAAFSFGGYEATRICLENFKKKASEIGIWNL